MRIRNLQELVSEVGYATASESAREAILAHHGPRAAAWLVNAHRKQFRRVGIVDFALPRKAELPMWMALALETLRRRDGWDAREISPSPKSPKRTFRVTRNPVSENACGNA